MPEGVLVSCLTEDFRSLVALRDPIPLWLASIDLTSEEDEGLEDILLLMGVLFGRTDLNFPIDGMESLTAPEDRECAGDMVALASRSSINSGSEDDKGLEDILLLVGVLLLLGRTDLNFPIDDGSESTPAPLP